MADIANVEASLSMRDRQYMEEAIALALKGLNTCTPNPRVGCLIVSSAGVVVGRGHHHKAGQAHAEINALNDSGENVDGATAYVTLEPCAHQGRTGPCSDALIKAGVATVVYGMMDPNPQVAGRGVQRLRDAGITVRGPVLEKQIRALNPGFISRMERQRPWVRCKLAMSLDGRTAMASGESQWITAASARDDVQALRARSCAILTGADTVLLDDPAMTVRSERFYDAAFDGRARQPQRYIIDGQVRLTGREAIFQSLGETFVFRPMSVTHDQTTSFGIARESMIQLDLCDARLDLKQALAILSKREINEVLLETGAKLAGAFLHYDLIDELVIYMAGKIMGSSARPLFDLPLEHMGQTKALVIQSIEPIGGDWKIIAHSEA